MYFFELSWVYQQNDQHILSIGYVIDNGILIWCILALWLGNLRLCYMMWVGANIALGTPISTTSGIWLLHVVLPGILDILQWQSNTTIADLKGITMHIPLALSCISAYLLLHVLQSFSVYISVDAHYDFVAGTI